MGQTNTTANPDNRRVSADAPPNTIDGEMLPVRDDGSRDEFDAVDTLTRLIVGGVVDASDLTVKLLEHWNDMVLEQHEATINVDEEDAGDILRYLLIGLVFEGQHVVRSSLRTAGSMAVDAAGTAATITRPIRNSWLFSPVRKTTEAVTSRLDSRIEDLVSNGRTEEFIGRLLPEQALQDSVDWTVDYIAQNPQVRDLVQQQALGFTEEITIGVRERTITADNLFDGLLRKLFRRTSRADLPGPPEEVKQLEKQYNQMERGNAS